jgi:hypothetical protein
MEEHASMIEGVCRSGIDEAFFIAGNCKEKLMYVPGLNALS